MIIQGFLENLGVDRIHPPKFCAGLPLIVFHDRKTRSEVETHSRAGGDPGPGGWGAGLPHDGVHYRAESSPATRVFVTVLEAGKKKWILHLVSYCFY